MGKAIIFIIIKFLLNMINWGGSRIFSRGGGVRIFKKILKTLTTFFLIGWQLII